MASPGQTQRTRYEWTPAFWKGWRDSGNLYRRYKSERDRTLALALLAPRDGEHILEVGCGYGWVSHALWQAANIEWVGIDLSDSMLRYLQHDAGTRPLIRADVTRLPIADRTFDKVLCSGVLMHVDDDRGGLQELARVLRPGGKLVFTINNAFSLYNLPVRIHNLLKAGFVQKFRSPARVRRLLRDLGLQPLAMMGDGIITTQPLCLGRFSLPPQSGFSLIRAVDHWAVSRFVGLAFEVWFSAAKP